MPTVLRAGGYQFIIFTSDHPPAHVHVRGGGKLAKVRLDSIGFERFGGFSAGEQIKIVEIVRDNRDFLLSEWTRLYPPEEMNDE
jgi:hypothetical protein